MGMPLAFMFMVNLFGAILLAPALAAFLIRDRRAAPKASTKPAAGLPR
jgi:hypothetical protein